MLECNGLLCGRAVNLYKMLRFVVYALNLVQHKEGLVWKYVLCITYFKSSTGVAYLKRRFEFKLRVLQLNIFS